MNETRTPAALTPAEQAEKDLGLERLIFFSDAVFAIVITLLALDLRLPASEGYLDNRATWNGLIAILPKFLAYFLSFFIVGAYWLGHHRIFNLVKHFDRTLLWLNLILLSFIGLVPFATELLSETGNSVATLFYAAVMGLVGMTSAGIWFYATRNSRLLDRAIEPGLWRRVMLRMLIAPTVFLLSIPLAFIDDDLAKYSWIIIAAVIFIHI